MDISKCTYTSQQFVFIREAPTQKGIVVTNAAAEAVEPWPEVRCVPANTLRDACTVEPRCQLQKLTRRR
jgi:hypothetical protein